MGEHTTITICNRCGGVSDTLPNKVCIHITRWRNLNAAGFSPVYPGRFGLNVSKLLKLMGFPILVIKTDVSCRWADTRAVQLAYKLLSGQDIDSGFQGAKKLAAYMGSLEPTEKAAYITELLMITNLDDIASNE